MLAGGLSQRARHQPDPMAGSGRCSVVRSLACDIQDLWRPRPVDPLDTVALAAKHFPSYANPVQDDAVDALIAIHISPLASGMVNEDPGEEVWLRGCFGGRDRSGAEHGEGGDNNQKLSHLKLPFHNYNFRPRADVPSIMAKRI